MAKREKRLTRAQKIEQSRIEASELRVFKSKPWWPVKATEEATAVEIVGRKLQTIHDLTTDFNGNPLTTLDSEDAKELQEIKKYLDEVPSFYVEKGQEWLDHRLRLKRLREEQDDYIDDYDPEQAAIDEEIARGKWLQSLKEMSMEQLVAYRDKLSDQQGRLGDAEHIDDRKVEEVENKWRTVDSEILRRKAQAA